MRFTSVSCLLAALFSASHVLADTLPAPTAGSVAESDSPAATPAPELIDAQRPHLEVRQGAAINPVVGATINPEQYPAVTTGGLPSAIGTSETWVQVVYTQTFPSIPDQWPSAGPGSIGYGTLTKAKRDVEPRETAMTETVNHLEVRQAATTGATLDASYPPTETTNWVESTTVGGTTWVEEIYTQTFASVPDQLPSAGSGAIGYGTLKKTKSKRDIEPRQTGSGIAGRLRII